MATSHIVVYTYYIQATRRGVGALALAATSLLAGNASAQDWAQWRGPTRDGILLESDPNRPWPEALTLQWEKNVGDGLSSPVVAGGRIFVQTLDGGAEVISALDYETGRELWRHTISVTFAITDPSTRRVGIGPRATPTVWDGILYSLSIDGKLSALDASTGRHLWTRDRNSVYRTSYPKHGHAASPLVVDGLVVTPFGNDTEGELTAFDARTGKLKWSSTTDAPSYASPVVAALIGLRQIVVLTARSLIGVDIADGELLWEVEFFTGSSNATSPLVFGDRVIVSGFQRGPHAFRVFRRDGEFRAEPAWNQSRYRNWISDYVLYGSQLIGFSETRRGQLVALDAKSGGLQWSSEGGLGGSARILRGGNSLFVSLSAGSQRVLKLSPSGPELVADYRVAEEDYLSLPVIRGRDLVVRARTHLSLWR